MGRRPLPREHGTRRGYQQHLWRKEVPCGFCTAGNARASDTSWFKGRCAHGLGWPLEARRA